MPAVSGETWWLSQGWYSACDTHCPEPAWDFNSGSGDADLGTPVVSGGDGIVCLAGGSTHGYGRVVVVHRIWTTRWDDFRSMGAR